MNIDNLFAAIDSIDNNDDKKQLVAKIKELQQDLFSEEQRPADENNMLGSGLSSGLSILGKTHQIFYNGVNIGLAHDEDSKNPSLVEEYSNDMLSNAWKTLIDVEEEEDDDDEVEEEEDDDNEPLSFDALKKFLVDNNLDFLDNGLLRSAVQMCNLTFEWSNCGQMYFQQTVYATFSTLLMAASPEGKNTYAAAEDVGSSLWSTCRHPDTGTGIPCDITLQPDAACLLFEGRDAFGVIEIQPKQEKWDYAQRRDFDKCIMTTASTASLLKKFHDRYTGTKVKTAKTFKHEDVALPFLIGRGNLASLYVTTFEGENILIRSVKGLLLEQCNMLLPRKQIFVCLAVLLARFRRQISRVHNRLKVDYTTEANYGGRLFSSTKKRSGESEHGSSKVPVPAQALDQHQVGRRGQKAVQVNKWLRKLLNAMGCFIRSSIHGHDWSISGPMPQTPL